MLRGSTGLTAFSEKPAAFLISAYIGISFRYGTLVLGIAKVGTGGETHGHDYQNQLRRSLFYVTLD